MNKFEYLNWLTKHEKQRDVDRFNESTRENYRIRNENPRERYEEKQNNGYYDGRGSYHEK